MGLQQAGYTIRRDNACSVDATGDVNLNAIGGLAASGARGVSREGLCFAWVNGGEAEGTCSAVVATVPFPLSERRFHTLTRRSQ